MKATKIFKWEMAHKLSRSFTSKCQHIHGHSYSAEITLEAAELDANGVVIDFTRIKQVLGALIDSFDHSFMFFGGDMQVLEILPSLLKNSRRVIECNFEPTAENVAAYLFDYLENCGKFDAPNEVVVASVKVWETASCFAEATENSGKTFHLTFHNC